MKFIQVEKGKYLNINNLGTIQTQKQLNKTWAVVLYASDGDFMDLCILPYKNKGVEVNDDMADNILRYIINSLHLFVEDKVHVILEKEHFQTLVDQYLEILTNKKDFDTLNTKGFTHE